MAAETWGRPSVAGVQVARATPADIADRTAGAAAAAADIARTAGAAAAAEADRTAGTAAADLARTAGRQTTAAAFERRGFAEFDAAGGDTEGRIAAAYFGGHNNCSCSSIHSMRSRQR